VILRLTLGMTPVDSELVLPIHYNHLVQGLIYRVLDSRVATFLHNRGFKRGSRSFRLFTFSRLLGSFRLNRQANTIVFTGKVRLVISSPYDAFCESLGKIILSYDRLRIGDGLLRLDGISVATPRVTTDAIDVDTLSPITLYSTLPRPDGTSFTYYFHPREVEFKRLLLANLIRKYEAFKQQYDRPAQLEVVALGKTKLNIVKYKGGVIKGFSGKFRLTGPRELLQLGLDAGFGSKNAQGFGLCELIEGTGS